MKELESGLKKMILGESLCTRINELESSAVDMQTELEKLKAELSEKNALIDSLHSQLDETSKAAESARAEIKMLNDISARTGKVLSEAIERADMYESIMDAMPFYIQAVDDNLNWTFANKEFTSELQKAGIVGESRENLYGLNSVNDKVILCSTSENAFKKFVERGIQNSNYEMNGKKMYQETSELKNSSGEKLGLVSFSFDRTDVMKALEEAEKMAKIQKSIGAYQDAAVEKVIANLEKLAAGDLDMDLDLDEPTEDTKATAEKFEKLNDNLVRSVEAIRALVFDASYMAANAVDGYLDYRSDETKHGGEFAQVMRGLNATIDAVQAPIAEAMNILKRVADGDLNSRMMGNYKGEYANIQNIVNSTTINLQNYVAEMSLVLAEISRGNLNQEVTGDYRGDFCEMKNSLNNIINSLNDVMSDINDVSNNVNSSSRQVSDGAQKLSEGSARQATSVQQLSETVGVLSEQVRQNAADAMRANDLSKDVMNQADEGNRQMQEMLRAMEEINQSSANISKIIKVIDDIAFQTNILALNAAVEAARAGVHGKGFAVVADEVRSLASKSAQAANETTALIKGSIASVKAGSAITEKTAAALTKIVSGITETSSICGTIAEVSASQNESFNNVNREINEVNKVVQTNSSTAEESASSAQALYNQSQNMKQVVSTFKLKDGKTPSTSIMQSLIASTGARQLSEGVTDRSDMPIITLTLD